MSGGTFCSPETRFHGLFDQTRHPAGDRQGLCYPTSDAEGACHKLVDVHSLNIIGLRHSAELAVFRELETPPIAG